MLHLLSNNNISGRKISEALHRPEEKVERACVQPANEEELQVQIDLEKSISILPTDEKNNWRPTCFGSDARHLIINYLLLFKIIVQSCKCGTY